MVEVHLKVSSYFCSIYQGPFDMHSLKVEVIKYDFHGKQATFVFTNWSGEGGSPLVAVNKIVKL